MDNLPADIILGLDLIKLFNLSISDKFRVFQTLDEHKTEEIISNYSEPTINLLNKQELDNEIQKVGLDQFKLEERNKNIITINTTINIIKIITLINRFASVFSKDKSSKSNKSVAI